PVSGCDELPVEDDSPAVEGVGHGCQLGEVCGGVAAASGVDSDGAVDGYERPPAVPLDLVRPAAVVGWERAARGQHGGEGGSGGETTMRAMVIRELIDEIRGLRLEVARLDSRGRHPAG